MHHTHARSRARTHAHAHTHLCFWMNNALQVAQHNCTLKEALHLSEYGIWPLGVIVCRCFTAANFALDSKFYF